MLIQSLLHGSMIGRVLTDPITNDRRRHSCATARLSRTPRWIQFCQHETDEIGQRPDGLGVAR
jgi:hypothetical protein